MHEHYVYVVRCADGSLYTGYTRNPKARIKTHNAGKGSRYTRAHRPVELVACWCLKTKREALQIEYQIKQLSRVKKLEIIEEMACPEWLLEATKIANNM
ncbi:GIY-YIG nuclease family protein [Leptolyngbya sp. FACHB-16]|uniref:GIY-YIG nuclease family protein n=1 Tax=unclassified Leptolyngbya TaxID=2650499 RepID=UPI0016829705|nr:GIY-YIG nuclease family protein [Leptolyngbya sp. FACHB-16]